MRRDTLPLHELNRRAQEADRDIKEHAAAAAIVAAELAATGQPVPPDVLRCAAGRECPGSRILTRRIEAKRADVRRRNANFAAFAEALDEALRDLD